MQYLKKKPETAVLLLLLGLVVLSEAASLVPLPALSTGSDMAFRETVSPSASV